MGFMLKRDYCDVIMAAMASQITSLTIIYSNVHSGTDQRKCQSSASLAFVTREFPAPMASNAENVSIWWRRHEIYIWGQNMTWWYSNISYLLEIKIPLLVHKRFTCSHFNILRWRKIGLQFPDIFKYFSCMKIHKFRLSFPRSLLLNVQLALFLHWLRSGLPLGRNDGPGYRRIYMRRSASKL